MGLSYSHIKIYMQYNVHAQLVTIHVYMYNRTPQLLNSSEHCPWEKNSVPICLCDVLKMAIVRRKELVYTVLSCHQLSSGFSRIKFFEDD